MPIGVKEWVIAEGYIPPESHGPEPEMTSHETVCILNPSDHAAEIEIPSTTLIENRWALTV